MFGVGIFLPTREQSAKFTEQAIPVDTIRKLYGEWELLSADPIVLRTISDPYKWAKALREACRLSLWK